jgi:6-phosphogluconate dehydrogenase (decarboxylating)
MVPAAVVDEAIGDPKPLLEARDVLIDGGNSYYVDDKLLSGMRFGLGGDHERRAK